LSSSSRRRPRPALRADVRTAALARAARALAALALAALALAAPAGAQAPASAGIHPSFRPDRLGAASTLTLAIAFGGGSEGVPPPLTGFVLQLPAGLGIDLRGVSTCPPSRLSASGAAGCPRSSMIGRGRALLRVHAGSQTLPEEAGMSVFRGPGRGGHPSIEILGHGETPLDESTTSVGLLVPGGAPFGSKLIVSVPPVPTLVYEPNASFASLSLTVGGSGPAGRPGGTVAVPRRCPAGGFPFAARFTFADHSTASAAARVPCP
jgi:hypothetical protein